MDDDSSSMPILYLIAKVPRAGRSKTRLAKSIGEESAAEFARSSLLDLCESLASVVGIRKVILFAPEEEKRALSQLLFENLEPHVAREWSLEPFNTGETSSAELRTGFSFQGRALEGLGRGLARAAFASKNQRVCFIGMDTPHLPASLIEMCLMENHGANLIPAKDGGYVLLSIEVRDHIDPIEAFAHIRWSTEFALIDQATALKRAGVSDLSVSKIVFQDVDELEDLKDLACALVSDSSMKSTCARTYRFMVQEKFIRN